MAHAAHPLREEKLGNLLDIVFRAGLGDAQVVADVVAARSQPQGPAVKEDGFAQLPLLEVGVGQVVIEFHGGESLRENPFVNLRRSVVIPVDIGRIGPVPQLFGRSLHSVGLIKNTGKSFDNAFRDSLHRSFYQGFSL